MAFVGLVILCQDGRLRTALLAYRTAGRGNDSHHPTVFCYTNIELRASRWWNRRRGPDGPWSAVRARGRRDLISSAIGRPRVLPPPRPLPFPPRRISTTFCTLRLLASLAILPFLPPTFLHFVVSLVFRCSWAFSLAEFISPAKYSRLRLRYRPLHLHFFSTSPLLPISFHSFACIFPSVSWSIALIPSVYYS